MAEVSTMILISEALECLVGNSQLLVSALSRKVLLVVLLQVVEGVYHVFEPIHVVSIDVPVPQVAIAGVLGVTHLKRDQIKNSS